jgi:O-antigen ligase
MKPFTSTNFFFPYKPIEISIGCLVAAVPLFAVTNSGGMYWAAIALFALGVCTSFNNQVTFQKSEKLILASWLFYPIIVACDMLFRGGWAWGDFQQSSRFLMAIPVFLLMRKHKIPLEFILIGVFFGVIWSGSLGLYQKLHLGWPRAYGGTNGGEISYGNISLLLGFIGFALTNLLNVSKNKKLLIGLIVLGFGVMASIASGTKGGWLSVPLLLWVLIGIDPSTRSVTKIYYFLIFFSIILVIWWFSPFIQSRVNHIPTAVITYLQTNQITDGSASARLEMWKAAIYMINNSPLLGSGTNSYFALKQVLIQNGEVSNVISPMSGPHNQYLSITVQYGVLGLVSLLSIYWTLANHYLRVAKTAPVLSACGLLVVFGYMDFNLVDNLWGVNAGGVFFVISSAFFAGIGSRYLNSNLDKSPYQPTPHPPLFGAKLVQ